MEYRRLGKAGVKVSCLCLGTGVRGPMDEPSFTRAIDRAIDLGCNFIDCANNYGQGRSETVLGKAIRGKRDDLVIRGQKANRGRTESVNTWSGFEYLKHRCITVD